MHEIQDFGNKLAGTAARIAGILHLLGHAYNPEPWTTPIALDTLENAASIAQYFAEHAKVAFASMGADPKMENARQLWLKISQQGWDQFSQRDLWQHVRRSLRLEDLPELLQVLVEMGYLRQQIQQPGGPGRPRSPVYEVNPLTRTQNTQNPDRGGNFVDSVDSVYTHGREPGCFNGETATDPNQDVGEL